MRYGWLVLLLVGGYYAVTRLGVLPSAEDTRPAHSTVANGVGQRTDDELVHFVSFVLDDTQATWERTFAASGQAYRRSKLVLFTDVTNTGCGRGSTATGPFYCPADERVYIDLAFYRELRDRFGAPGRFAQAYVIAHEIGHHVQDLLGTTERAQAARGARDNGEGAGGISVRVELQADCFAGIWAHSTAERSLLENGDIESALGAASAIGDDRLQRSTTGTVAPETWTHGSSEQRARWFRRGFEQGRVEACDTFASKAL